MSNKNKKNKNDIKKVAYIVQNKCDKSPFCPVKRVCPVNAVTKQGFFGSVEIDSTKCIGCGKCIQYCPHGAVKMKK